MPGGRPTDYDDKVLEDTEWYLEHYNDEEIGDAIPQIAGLAKYLKVSRDTIYEWMTHEDKKEFSDTCKAILSEQELALINKGLTGEFNPAFTKFVLSANHNMREKSDVTSDGKQLPTPILSGMPKDE